MPRNPNLDVLRAERAKPENREGRSARELSIAYGLIRGRTMAQIESANSDPHQFPDNIKYIIAVAMHYFRPKNEGETDAEYAEAKRLCQASMEAELLAWKKSIHLTFLANQEIRRKRNAIKRLTPRTHRPRQVAS